MLENETLRRRREREFQSLVLKAIERTPQKRWSSVINAPIVIWLLSVLVAGFVGTFLTTANQCHVQAEQTIEQHEKVVAELRRNELEILDAISTSRSFEDFDNKLLEEDRRLLGHPGIRPLEFVAIRLDRILEAVEDHPDFNMRPTLVFQYRTTLFHNTAFPIDFEKWKREGIEFFKNGPSLGYMVPLGPVCSAKVVVLRMLGFKPRYLEFLFYAGN